MTENKDYFIEFGGHELAGGFTVHNDKIHFLEEALCVSFKRITTSSFGHSSLGKEERIPPLLVEEGLGNSKPVFLFKSVKIEKIKKFGKNGSGEHLEIIFSDLNNIKVKAISFFSNLESFQVKLEENLKVNLLATFEFSRFGGKEELRLRVIDIF